MSDLRGRWLAGLHFGWLKWGNSLGFDGGRREEGEEVVCFDRLAFDGELFGRPDGAEVEIFIEDMVRDSA